MMMSIRKVGERIYRNYSYERSKIGYRSNNLFMGIVAMKIR